MSKMYYHRILWIHLGSLSWWVGDFDVFGNVDFGLLYFLLVLNGLLNLHKAQQCPIPGQRHFLLYLFRMDLPAAHLFDVSIFLPNLLITKSKKNNNYKLGKYNNLKVWLSLYIHYFSGCWFWRWPYSASWTSLLPEDGKALLSSSLIPMSIWGNSWKFISGSVLRPLSSSTTAIRLRPDSKRKKIESKPLLWEKALKSSEKASFLTIF